MDELAVVVVNYRTAPLTAACVEHLMSLGEEAPARLVLVDNSPSGLLEEVAARHPDRIVHRPQEGNIGFAAAVNRGVGDVTQPFVVLLNPDARPEPGCLAGLVEVLRRGPGTAAGPAILPPAPDQPCLPSALRRDPGLLTTLIEYTAARRLAPPDWLERNYFLSADRASSSPTECAMVQGACLALRRDDLLRLGGFDASRFFLYWEETDLLRRLRAGGGRVLYCPHLRCVHSGGASVGGGQDELHFWRGLHRYHLKHSGRLRAWTLRVVLAVGIAVEVVVLATLDRLRGGADPVLHRDLRVARVRLREQLRRPTHTAGRSPR